MRVGNVSIYVSTITFFKVLGFSKMYNGFVCYNYDEELGRNIMSMKRNPEVEKLDLLAVHGGRTA